MKCSLTTDKIPQPKGSWSSCRKVSPLIEALTTAASGEEKSARWREAFSGFHGVGGGGGGARRESFFLVALSLSSSGGAGWDFLAAVPLGGAVFSECVARIKERCLLERNLRAARHLPNNARGIIIFFFSCQTKERSDRCAFWGPAGWRGRGWEHM